MNCITHRPIFFDAPSDYDEKQVRKRYRDDVPEQLLQLKAVMEALEIWDADNLSQLVKGYLNDKGLKMGVYLPLLRIIMCGAMTGPDLFELMALVGKNETMLRLSAAMDSWTDLTH
mgnify:FL=1